MAFAPHLRASDADREQVAETLRRHYGAGRLNTEEFEQRLTAAYKAVTYGDLAALTRDLPHLDLRADGSLGRSQSQSQSQSQPLSRDESHELALRETRDRIARQTFQRGGRGVVLFGGCTAIWAMSGAGFFWPGFVLLFVLLSVARTLMALYGPSPDTARIERELWRSQRRERLQMLRRGGAELGDEALSWWIAQGAARRAAAEIRRQRRREQ